MISIDYTKLYYVMKRRRKDIHNYEHTMQLCDMRTGEDSQKPKYRA